MAQGGKRARYDGAAAATAQFYNTTGTVPTSLHMPLDISYLVTTHPNCTIVVADLPDGCLERDLASLFSRYGQIKNTKLVCNGRAALVEFCEISPPTRLVHMAKINPFCVGPNRVRLEFSSETIVPERKQPQAPPENAPTRILHLDVSAADYPITVDVIKAICAPHGKLQRIFIGKKNVDRSLEALVEFETPEEAAVAKEQLDGADIYSGCCSLTVAYSKLQRVHVTQNDTDSWDFTGPNAAVEGPLNNAPNQRTLLGPASGASTALPSVTPSPILPAPAAMPPAGVAPTPYYPGQSFAPPGGFAPTFAQPPIGCYGMPNFGAAAYPTVPDPYTPPSRYPGATPVSTQNSIPLTRTTSTYTPTTQVVILPTPTPVHQVTANGIGIGHSTSNLSSTSAFRHSDASVFESVEGVVLMVCNLPSHMNCDHLFNLLCLYGNIARIKFLKTRPGCALVQVGSPEAADLIHRNYNGTTIFGHSIKFYHVKQSEIREHDNLGTLEDGSPVMKNYTMDPNNRFRNAVVAAKSRILEPARTLHFFNVPLNFRPEDVCRVFNDINAQCPPRVVIFSAKPGQKTSLGLVEWDTQEEALNALILANHRPIHLSGFIHPFHLKLAFSPKPISDDRAGLSIMQYPAPPLKVTKAAVLGTTRETIELPDGLDDEDNFVLDKAKDAVVNQANGTIGDAGDNVSDHLSLNNSCPTVGTSSDNN